MTWFRVYRPGLDALFRLAFASATQQNCLTLPVTVSRRIIMQKARRHPARAVRRPSASRAPTACRRVVSGSLSSPGRGSSHLSLALLGSLSVAREYLALRDGPRGFRLTSTCRVLLRYRIVRFLLSHTGLSPTLVELSSSLLLGYSHSKHRPYNPRGTCPAGLG